MEVKEDCSLSESQSCSSISSCGSGNDNGNSNSNNGEVKKCSDCQTTTTPLWRGGPAGPKTLCNACGIKYHKKRRALLGIAKGKVDKCKKKPNNNNNVINNNNNNNNDNNNNNIMKIKVMSSGMRQSDKVGEVEQAALLLMALSYGSVYV